MPRFEIFFGTLGTGTAIFGGVSLATVGSVVVVAGGIFGLGYAIYWLNKAWDGCGLDQGREMDGISGADNHGWQLGGSGRHRVVRHCRLGHTAESGATE